MTVENRPGRIGPEELMLAYGSREQASVELTADQRLVHHGPSWLSHRVTWLGE